MRNLTMWIALGLGVGGCAGAADKPTGDSGDTDTDTDTTPAAPTLTAISADVLQPTCALVGCHAAGSQQTSGLELIAGSEHDALVGVPSPTVPTSMFVVAGDPDASYLVNKLEDAVGITGTPMPPPFGGLDPDKIAQIRDWIAAGALDD